MIIEIFDSIINESYISNFEVESFNLGDILMNIFIEECKNNMGIPVGVNIHEITNYKGYPVYEHPDNNSITFNLSKKK